MKKIKQVVPPGRQPEENVDYHILRVKANQVMPEHYFRSSGTKQALRGLMQKEEGMRRLREGMVNKAYMTYIPVWVAVPGPRPPKEWGEVCL